MKETDRYASISSQITMMDCNSGDLASKDLIYKILTRETSIVSITLVGSILRIKANTASLISASISCSLEAPALITAAKTCNNWTTIYLFFIISFFLLVFMVAKRGAGKRINDLSLFMA